jgi:hypothetical protein
MPDEAACAGRIHVVGLLVEPGYVPTAAGKFVKNPASSPDSPWLASALAASVRVRSEYRSCTAVQLHVLLASRYLRLLHVFSFFIRSTVNTSLSQGLYRYPG